jgi:hypothetical protein
MTKNIDQLNIRIRGKAYLGRKLALGEHVKLVIEGDVVREETEDNQDGSVNICYIVHPMSVEELSSTSEPEKPLPEQSEEFADIDEMLGNKEPINPKDVPF